jgi:hypothetical protein
MLIILNLIIYEQKGTGGMIQEVVHLSSRCKAMSSKPQYYQKQNPKPNKQAKYSTFLTRIKV